MTRSVSIVLIASLLVAFALAGCLGGDAGGDDANAAVGADPGVLNPNLSGDELREELEQTLEITAESQVGAPKWTVGEFWTMDVVFAESLGGGAFTVTVVVAAEDGSSYTLLADNRDAAMFDAMFDLPFMGAFDKATLDTTFGNTPFKYYDWPLSGGKSWVAPFDPNFEGTSQDYTFHSAFVATIPTPAGDLPGFDIHGIDDEGFVRYQYDYVPALHWFNHVYWFNEDFPGDLNNADVHLMVTDHGFNWAGDLTRFASEIVLQKFWGVCPVCVLAPEDADPVTAESPSTDFTIAETVTDVSGFYFHGACDGVGVMQLSAPSGTKVDSRKVGLPPPEPPPADFPVPIGCEEEFGFVGVPAEAGTWNVRIVGAAAIFSGAFIQLYALTEEKVTIAATEA